MDKEENSSSILHDFDKIKPFFSGKFVFILIIVFVFGVASGYFLTRGGTGLNLANPIKNSGLSSASKGTVVGSDDLKTFKDLAEGSLKEGGIDGEGQFHLVRPGGDSQNVYLTSSIVDLSQYLGKKVKVWGETHKAQKAGWLMDVGRLEVLE